MKKLIDIIKKLFSNFNSVDVKQTKVNNKISNKISKVKNSNITINNGDQNGKNNN